MPPGFKVITRKGNPDSMVFEILYLEKARTYSKKYTVVRCNIPGEDPRFTKYPPRLFDKIPVDPSFASFYLDMKFGYNIPESRILTMLEKAGCVIPQATLNRWMHAVMEGLFETLMPEMKKAVRASRFTHNDETRILVRSQEKEEDNPSYKTEYIHGILSPEKNLFLMLYEQGSRAHTVQARNLPRIRDNRLPRRPMSAVYRIDHRIVLSSAHTRGMLGPLPEIPAPRV